MTQHIGRKQRVRDRAARQHYDGERSPYHDYMMERGYSVDLSDNIPESAALWQEPAFTGLDEIRLNAIKAAWKLLSPSQRIILTMYSQRNGYDTIAEELNISKRTVRTQIQRAKEKIKEVYKQSLKENY
jgi:RNA polymerase sigma factor (sigma-70 family)